MKLYIAGKITGDPSYHDKFQRAALRMRRLGHTVMSPSCLPLGFEWKEYLHICEAMIDVCDGVLFLPDWRESQGAVREYYYACEKNKEIYHYEGLTVPTS